MEKEKLPIIVEENIIIEKKEKPVESVVEPMENIIVREQQTPENTDGAIRILGPIANLEEKQPVYSENIVMEEPQENSIVPVIGEESINEVIIDKSVTNASSKKRRCPKGSRRYKKTNHCRRKTSKKTTKRCHKGFRRNRRTHRCRKRKLR